MSRFCLPPVRFGFVLVPLVFLTAVTPSAPITKGSLPPSVPKWFEKGRCEAFQNPVGLPPRVKSAKGAAFSGDDHLRLRGDAEENAGAGYDDAHHVAVLVRNGTVGSSYELRALNRPPPAGVDRVDLSAVVFAGRIRIGTRANAVVAVLGRPAVGMGCGQMRYSYRADRFGTLLDIIIDDGRVIDISWVTQD